MTCRLKAGSTLVAALATLAIPALARAQSAQSQTTLPTLDVTTKKQQPVAKKKQGPATTTTAAQQPAQQATTVQTQTSGGAVAPGIGASSAGQTVTTIDRDRAESTRAFSVGDLLQDSPGISIKQGNGPRDMGVSIRGSNARNGFGVRNIQVFEDGFQVTQPDGLSRTDLTDPHAYGGVDVWRGPSSALFGNYATGGAINFRTRTGAEINGFEYGVDIGSFGYVNNYLALGEKVGNFEYALFSSDVRAAGHLDYNSFNTQTVNLLASYTPSGSDTFTFKFIHNSLDTGLSTRLSLSQFTQNPYQRGCDTTFTTALTGLGCASTGLFRNGYNSTRDSVTAAQAGFNRHDQRTIVGTRWEHKVDANTEWQVQFVVDDRNISQPTGTTSAVGDFLSTNFSASLTQRYSLFGAPAKHITGIFTNNLPNDSYTYNLTSAGNATLGRITQNVNGGTTNAGVRMREEIQATRAATVVLGAAVEQSHVYGVSTGYAYNTANVPTATISTVVGDREFVNRAYEAGLQYRIDRDWQLRGRVASGYGTPQISNLFTTSNGTAGNNTSLQAQTNIGYDLGIDYTFGKLFKLSVTGFYEFFDNEIVQQATSSNAFAFNAPHSEHRGVEVAAEWRPFSGWRGTVAYLYNDQVYTEYGERLSGSTTIFDRAGHKIPGNSSNELLARLGYDQPAGVLKGLGTFVEYQWKDAFFMDNGNLLKAPGYDLVNFNVHYSPELNAKDIRGLTLFVEVRNVFDRAYIASANNIANTITNGQETPGSTLATSGTGSIYAGMPRTFYGGVKVKF